MTAAVIVYLLIVTLPVVLAGLLAERACRLWALPVRGAWIATALLIGMIGGRTVAHQMELPSATARVASITTPHIVLTAASPTRFAMIASAIMSLPRGAATSVAHAVGPARSRLLAVLWGAMSVVVLALMMFVYARVWYARRAWPLAEFGGQQIRVAPHAGPAVVGLFRPEIVVPHWLLDSDPDDGRLIVMHEMEHRSAHDPALLAAMWLLVVLFPWHPGAWYCLTRTRLAIELDCDARVVRRGESLRSYAQLLVNQARARLGAPLHLWLGATSLLQPSSHLERRLRAMIIPDSSGSARRPAARYLRTLSYFAIVSTIAIAACESHVPTAADITGLDAAGAEKNARQISLIDTEHPVYYVNNVLVSTEAARTIAPDNIKSIAVIKTSAQHNQPQIRILTKDATGPDSVVALDVANTARSGELNVTGGVAAPRTVRLTITGKPGSSATPAIMIDGVASSMDAMQKLNPADIESVDVVKGPEALNQSSDPLARNGLIRITLKH